MVPTDNTDETTVYLGVNGKSVETLEPDFVLYHLDFLKTPGLSRELL